ncbi:MAG: hypothetical protein JWN30_118, partial [Bacilli bacterium]|nr:hypothetical protein [Bacilli bacterium]
LLRTGGEINERAVCELILREFRAGQIGRISLETADPLSYAKESLQEQGAADVQS